MVVDFRLLGPVEIRIDGRVVDAGHARQLCVLATLLVDANRVVSPDSLVNRVWGAGPPQRALGTLQGYLSRLRQVLSGVDDVSITRRSNGYVLTTPPAAVDLYRFDRLVAQGRSVRDDGLLSQALDLWRGEPFTGLHSPFLAASREMLDRRRHAARLDRYDIVLDRGTHRELVCELAEANAEHPLDERLAGQLMLALYRCGRQAEALAVFHRVRGQLAGEVGTDPSPPLDALFRRILNADGRLAAPAPPAAPPPQAPAPAASPPGFPVPRQLPASPGVFCGRTAELADLDGLLPGNSDGTPPMLVATIGGTGGVGKTWLALRWAHTNRTHFPDGQLYVNLRGFDPVARPVPATVALRGFLDALGVEPARIPAEPAAQSALYRSLVAGRRLLVVLDNAPDGATVVPLLPGTPAARVLITSRRRLTGLVVTHGARPLALDVLPGGDAHELLRRHLGASRVAAEPDAVDAVLRSCAGLPLAVAIVAARAAVQPGLRLAALAAELATGAMLDALDGGDPDVDLRAVLAGSVRALRDAAAAMFVAIGSAPGPDLGLAAAASLAGTPLPAARALLRELCGANLVQEHGPGRYRMHDLVRRYATEQAGAAADPTGTHRVLDHYVHSAYHAALVLSPQRDPIAVGGPVAGVVTEQPADVDASLRWFTVEHPNLMAAIHRAATARFDRHAIALAWTLATYFDRRGHWHDWATAQSTALAAARRLGDRPALAEALEGI